MKLREKIIILAALLAGIYGLADYFIFAGKSDQGQALIQKAALDLDTYAAAASAKLAVSKLKDPDKVNYLISRAESDWPRDPFMGEIATEIAITDTDLDAKGPELVYSGFIRAGKIILAVVNGIEYRIGEVMNDVGYKVAGITPSQVILLTETNKEIVIDIEED